jgi:hypothetical protein
VTTEIALALITLSVWGLLGAWVAAFVAARKRTVLNFPTLSIGIYLVVYVVSGLAHLGGWSGSSRGYFDIFSRPQPDIWGPVLGSVLGLVALCAPPLWRSRKKAMPAPPSPVHLDGPSRGTLLLVGAVLLPFTLVALVTMSNYAETLDTRRIISLTDGMARVGFLSQWFTWSVSFIALALIASPRNRSQLHRVLLLAITAVLITVGLSWTGGRAIVFMMVLPILLAVWPLVSSRARLLLLSGLTVAAAVNLISTTVTRTAQYARPDLGFGSVLDWQFGRFSMLAFADEVADKGLFFGETILSGALEVPIGILQILNLPMPFAPPTSITSVSGEYLLGDSNLRYIVPGMSAELWMNFGIGGVVAGYLFLGWITSWVDEQFQSTDDLALRFAWAYAGVLLLFCTMSAQSGAIYNYALFTGLPVVLLLITRRKVGASGPRAASRGRGGHGGRSHSISESVNHHKVIRRG